MRNVKVLRPAALLVAAIAFAVGLAACGGSDDDKGSEAKSTGNPKEQAFLQSMVAHHEEAVMMANMAQRNAKRPQIRQLADAIVAAQQGEITQMNRIYARLFSGAQLKPDMMASDELGVSDVESGAMEPRMMNRLENARPFERMFIDTMIPHHQGAIRQARAVLAATDDPQMTALAKAIISAQSREIEQMNGWRERWYGKPSPAGGVPPA